MNRCFDISFVLTKISIVTCPFTHYTALGDSYAAGLRSCEGGRLPICNGTSNNSTQCTTKLCGKNVGAYGWQFNKANAENFKVFTFLPCSGATTSSCLKKQVPYIPLNTDLVTIDIGGNNGNAFARVLTCVYVIGQVGCARALKNAQDVIKKIAPDLRHLLNQINVAAPTAKVVVLGYVQFWPAVDVPIDCQSNSLRRPTAVQKAKMNQLVVDMNAAIEQAAIQTGCHYVDVDKSFEGHRLCEPTPWIQWELFGRPGFGDGDDDGITDPNLNTWNSGVFHPTFEGQRQYASQLAAATGCKSNEAGCEAIA